MSLDFTDRRRLRKNQTNREWHRRNRTPCRKCGGERPYPSKSRYCSDECRKSASRKRNALNQQRLQDKFDGYKTERGCARCGYKKCAAALEFHHLDPTEKSPRLFERSSITSRWFQEEVAKCILLCANCHREEHHG